MTRWWELGAAAVFELAQLAALYAVGFFKGKQRGREDALVSALKRVGVVVRAPANPDDWFAPVSRPSAVTIMLGGQATNVMDGDRIEVVRG